MVTEHVNVPCQHFLKKNIFKFKGVYNFHKISLIFCFYKKNNNVLSLSQMWHVLWALLIAIINNIIVYNKLDIKKKESFSLEKLYLFFSLYCLTFMFFFSIIFYERNKKSIINAIPIGNCSHFNKYGMSFF